MDLKSTKKVFEYYQNLGSTCVERLTFDELKYTPNAESNSVAVMVKHLWGNMLSRWTDFLNSDGEKPWRERDLEFEDEYNSKDDIWKHWKEGWDCLFSSINSLSASDLDKIVYIRNEGHTVSEALERQLAHYAYHVGQMVFLAKIIKGNDWTSLSIPKNESTRYNEGKFSEEKKDQHYTDEV
jgi:hypothetical protein